MIETGHGLSVLMETFFNGSPKVERDMLIKRLTEHTHRTIQQAIMRNFVVPLILKWAEQAENGQYDARNQATVRTAAELAKVLEGKFFPTI